MSAATLRGVAGVFFIILGLTTAAIALPVYQTLGSEATFFVAHGSSSLSIVMFGLAWFFIPPLIVLGIVALIWLLDRGAGRIALAISVGALGAVALAQVIPGYNDWPAWAAVGLLAVVAPVLAWLFHTRERLRDFLRVIGYIAPAALLLFFFLTPVNELVLPSDVNAVGEGAARDDDVVFVVFDEFALAALLTPEHEIDAVRAPNLARLADTATWYREATTVSWQTALAVPAILTGDLPVAGTIPIASNYPQSLFTAMAPSHQLSVDEVITRLCPGGLCERRLSEAPGDLYEDSAIVYLHTLLPTDLASRWLPSVDDRWTGFGQDGPDAAAEPAPDATPVPAADLDAAEFSEALVRSDIARDQVARWRQYIDGIAANEHPTVSYVHMMLPHTPFKYLGDGRLYNGNQGDGLGQGAVWVDDQQLVDVATHGYLLQVEYVDRLIGELLDQLEATGRLDDTLLVVAADHGVSLTAGTHRRHPEADTLSEIAQVPLFIKYPGQTDGHVDDRLVQTIDILPTIAESMGVTMAEPMDGQSLLGDEWQTPDRAIVGPQQFDSDFSSSLDLDKAISVFTNVVPAGTPASDAYGIGAARPLVGVSVDDLELALRSPVEVVSQTSPHLYSDVNLESGVLPVRYLAEVRGADRGAHIVVAVNGVVAGSGIVSDISGSDGISVLLDPDALVDGANSIRTFQLEDGRLRPTEAASSDDVALAFDDEGRLSSVTLGERTWAGTGRTYQMEVSGWQDMLAVGAEPPVEFIGWAADTSVGASWEKLLLVDGQDVISDIFERLEDLDVANAFGESALRSGFRIFLGPALGERVSDLRVVALFEDGSIAIHNGEVAPAVDLAAYGLIFDDIGSPIEVTFGERTWSGTKPGYMISVAGWDAMKESADEMRGVFNGFALDAETGASWESLLLLDGDEVVETEFERVLNDGLAESFGESALEAGFRFFPDPALAERAQELRIVALFADGSLVALD